MSGRVVLALSCLLLGTTSLEARPPVRVAAHAAPRLRVTVSGSGELAALANGDPGSTEGFRGTERTAWRGRALGIVRPTGPGEIRVRVEAAALEPAEVSITAR